MQQVINNNIEKNNNSRIIKIKINKFNNNLIRKASLVIISSHNSKYNSYRKNNLMNINKNNKDN